MRKSLALWVGALIRSLCWASAAIITGAMLLILLACPRSRVPLEFPQANGKDKIKIQLLDGKLELRLLGSGYPPLYGGDYYGLSLRLQVHPSEGIQGLVLNPTSIELLLEDSTLMNRKVIEGRDYWSIVVDPSEYVGYLRYYAAVHEGLVGQTYGGAVFRICFNDFISVGDSTVPVDTILVFDPCRSEAECDRASWRDSGRK